MRDVWYALTVAVVLLTGCGGGADATDSAESAPPSASAPAPEAKPLTVLDGVYTVVLDLSEQRSNGRDRPGEPVSMRFAFRSSCAEDSCVATGAQLKWADPQALSATTPPFVLDFTDGEWSGALRRDKVCGDATLPGIEAWRFTPQAEGTLSGTGIALIGGDCSAVNEYPMTLTRSGDIDAGIVIADPAEQPPLSPSAGESYRGRYQKTWTRNGAVAADHTETVTTTCVRNTEQCLAYGVADAGASALELIDGVWTNRARYESTCKSGSPAMFETTVEIPMPADPVDPIVRLQGTQRDVPGEPCPGVVESTIAIERTGD